MENKKINERWIAKGLITGFFIMLAFGRFGTFTGNKPMIFFSLLCSLVCIAFLIVMIANKTHTYNKLIKIMIYLNIIALIGIFCSLLCSLACMTLLIVMIANKTHTYNKLINIVIFLNIIAFTSHNIKMLGVSLEMNLLMTGIQCVCAVIMGICILILLQKFFDDVEDESKTI